MQLQLTRVLPRDSSSIPVTRRILADAMTRIGVSEECISDTMVALSEACTNVLDHATWDDSYEVVASIDDSTCLIEVIDRGTGFDPKSLGHQDAAADAEGGRGIQLMRRLVDRVRFERRARGGTVVRLEKSLVWREDAPLQHTKLPATRATD
jgi:serine/threonine-protein kinase RsbW